MFRHNCLNFARFIYRGKSALFVSVLLYLCYLLIHGIYDENDKIFRTSFYDIFLKLKLHCNLKFVFERRAYRNVQKKGGKRKKKKWITLKRLTFTFFKKRFPPMIHTVQTRLTSENTTKISKLLSQNLYVHVAPTIYSLSIVIMRVSI